MFIIKTWWIEGGFPELLTMETDAKVIEFYVRIYSAPQMLLHKQLACIKLHINCTRESNLLQKL